MRGVMYKLFATKESYAMTGHLILEELGLDYEVIWADFSKPVPERDPEHLAATRKRGCPR